MIIKKIKNPLVFVLTLFFLTLCSGLSAPAQWVTVRDGQPLPVSAAIGGTEQGKSLYICRAFYNNGVHPGKVVSGQCNISWDGKEITVRRFEVYTDKVFWDKKRRGQQKAIAAGSENGQPLYLCRAKLTRQNVSLGVHPGKVVAGKCNFGYAGVEEKASDFEFGYTSQFEIQWNDHSRQEPQFYPEKGQIYRIVSVRSGKVLDVRGPSPDNGTVIQQWGNAGVDNQKWRFESTGDGYYYIRSVYSKKCLDVRGPSNDNGAIIQQWDCVGVDNQKWKLVKYKNSIIFVAKSSGKVLDLEAGSMDDGGGVHQWERHNRDNQQWRIEKL